MPGHGATPLASFWSENDQWIAAVLAIVLAAAGALLVDRAFARRGRRLATRFTGGELTPVVDTRLRFLRRVAEASIVVVGVAVALSQFQALDKIATSVLASGALAAAVVGFAARQTLANAIAGLMLAVAQPLRIGDRVLFEGETGDVEDVRLTYTYLRTGTGARVVIPNERLAAGVLRNDTILEPTVQTEVSLWLAPEADAVRAVEVLRAAVPEATPRLAEVAVEGSRVALAGPPTGAAGAAAREDDLRARAFTALRGAGLR